jgi:hypothetical protein
VGELVHRWCDRSIVVRFVVFAILWPTVWVTDTFGKVQPKASFREGWHWVLKNDI